MYFPTELEFMSLHSTNHFTNRPQSSLSSGSGSNDSGFFASIHGVSTEVPSLSNFAFDMDSPHGVSPIPYDGDFGTSLLKCDSPPQINVNSLQPNKRYFCENRIQINPNVKNVENHQKLLGGACLSDKVSHVNLLGDYINHEIRQQKSSNGVSELSSNFMTEPPTQALIEAASKPLNQQQVSQNSKASKSDSYKTVMCQAWLESKNCNFGENCRFAHGEEELRPLKQNLRYNTKYKTKLCDRYTNTGICPYGDRCLFVHPNNGNAYFSNEKMAELQNVRSSSNNQVRTTFPNKDEASYNNVLVANSDNSTINRLQQSPQTNMVVKNNNNNNNNINNNNNRSQTPWSTERSTVNNLNSCFSMAGFEQSIMFGNDISTINNNSTNNNNNYSMDRNSMYQMIQNPMVDNMMINPTSTIWKNLMYNTFKNSDTTDSYLLTPKLSKDLSCAFGSMSLKEESPIDSGAFNNEILERSIAMLNDFEDH